jgi:hypothetical protein
VIDLARLRRMLAPVRHPDAISVPEHYLWMWLSLQHRTLELLEAELLRAEYLRKMGRR